MRLGFTGSRVKPTAVQEVWLRDRMRDLRDLGYDTFQHGDCVGGDETAHKIARDLGMRVIVHPPDNLELRAFCRGDEMRNEMSYRDRNKWIVTTSDFMLALPSGAEQAQPRSGTWMTVRMARRCSVPLCIYPEPL